MLVVILGDVHRGRCQVLFGRAGLGPGPPAQAGHCLQRPQARKVSLLRHFEDHRVLEECNVFADLFGLNNRHFPGNVCYCTYTLEITLSSSVFSILLDSDGHIKLTGN